jgi:hypothetical protein
MRLGWLFALLLSFTLLLDASPLVARGRERIAIIGVAAGSALGRQLRIELTTRGYDVLLLEPSARSTAEQLEAAGREPDMKAAIRVGSGEGGDVEVWLKSGPGTLSLHSVETTHAEARVTALRSAERLRASLLELPAEPQMQQPRAAAPVARPVQPAASADGGIAPRPLRPGCSASAVQRWSAPAGSVACCRSRRPWKLGSTTTGAQPCARSCP